ncbi:MAG: hypothetical protein WC263_00905 [Candidatus Micrarchaeia archaeon]
MANGTEGRGASRAGKGAAGSDAAKRKLTPAEMENYLRIKKRLFELYEEDGKLRAELDKMGLKFERKWWHGPLGKPANFEA